MRYFRLVNDAVAEVSSTYPKDWREGWISARDMRSLEHAEEFAAKVSDFCGERFMGIDNGANVSPRYEVIRAPAIGDKVSYAFNGDSYPDGEIVAITAGTFRNIRTTTGTTYYRRRQSGSWMKQGGTWSLVNGHRNDRNPEF